jgi:hypothetical protein
MPLSIITFHEETPQLVDSEEGFIPMKLVKEQIKFGGGLLPFSSIYFVFLSPI